MGECCRRRSILPRLNVERKKKKEPFYSKKKKRTRMIMTSHITTLAEPGCGQHWHGTGRDLEKELCYNDSKVPIFLP